MDQELADKIGHASRSARKQRGWTQAELAERVGISTKVYGRLERGEMLPSVETLRKLCTVLGTPADALLGLGNQLPETLTVEPTPAARVALEARRLVRRLNQLSRRQVRLLGELAGELANRGGRSPSSTK